MKTIIDSYKLNLEEKTYACFVDLRKAFDSVWHYGLFLKMLKCGLSESFINILLNMHSSLKTCVKLDNGLSPDFFRVLGYDKDVR